MLGESRPSEEASNIPTPNKQSAERRELPLTHALGEQARPAEKFPGALEREKEITSAKKTAETRHELTRLTESHADTSSHHPSPPDPKKRLEEFEAFQQLFSRKREELIGPPTPETWLSHFTTKTPIGKGMLNFARIVPDMIQRIQSLGKVNSLKETGVKATVVNREEFVNDTRFRGLFGIEKNKKALENFLTREVDAEVNSTRFLMLEGLTPAQFHSWVRQLGYSPFAFLSDDRGENKGRASIDNDWPADGRHPLIETTLSDEEMQQEKALWEPVFPKLTWLPYIGKWRMSRTHSVVYGVKDQEGKDVLILPVHMDARNAVVAFRDLADKIFGKKREGRGALDYHKMHTGQEKYVGTGLYDLGIKNLLRLFEEHGDKIGGLEIAGREKLQTTGTIVGDDRITWQINDMVKGKTQ